MPIEQLKLNYVCLPSDGGCDIQLRFLEVSRHHAKITFNADTREVSRLIN